MTNAEARFNNSLRPRKPEGSLGRTAQDGHLDSHTAPELSLWRRGEREIIYLSVHKTTRNITLKYTEVAQFTRASSSSYLHCRPEDAALPPPLTAPPPAASWSNNRWMWAGMGPLPVSLVPLGSLTDHVDVFTRLGRTREPLMKRVTPGGRVPAPSSSLVPSARCSFQ